MWLSSAPLPLRDSLVQQSNTNGSLGQVQAVDRYTITGNAILSFPPGLRECPGHLHSGCGRISARPNLVCVTGTANLLDSHVFNRSCIY